MRGRRQPKIKVPRARRQKVVTTGKALVVFPCLGGRAAYVTGPGQEQSVVQFVKSEGHQPTGGCYPNTWFHPRTERVKLKIDRVPLLKQKRVRLK